MANSALTTEWRSRPRFKLNLELQFSYRRGKRTWHGTGRTRDFRDEAICFESDQELPSGVELELCIAWPVCPQSLCPLDMIVHGAVVTRQRSLAVVRLEQFELRTRSDVSFHERAAKGDLCNVLA